MAAVLIFYHICWFWSFLTGETILKESVAIATTLITVHCKLFQMMPYIIKVKVRKFRQPAASCFSTAREKPLGGHNVPPILSKVKIMSDTQKQTVPPSPFKLPGNNFKAKVNIRPYILVSVTSKNFKQSQFSCMEDIAIKKINDVQAICKISRLCAKFHVGTKT